MRLKYDEYITAEGASAEFVLDMIDITLSVISMGKITDVKKDRGDGMFY